MIRQNPSDKFIKEVHFEPAKKVYDTSKGVVKHHDNNWSLSVLDIVGYGLKKNRSNIC